MSCSGDMWVGVPTTVPTCVSDDDSMRAIPKSMIFSFGPGVIIRFAGLMSRCTTPCLCE